MPCKLSNSKSSNEMNNNKSSLALFFSREIEKLCLTLPMPNLLIEGDMGMSGVLQLSSKKLCIVCGSRRYVSLLVSLGAVRPQLVICILFRIVEHFT